MPSNDDQIIELSIDETNKLRAELGLAPLRINDNIRNGDIQHSIATSNQNEKNNDTEQVLELSISETNSLRAKLGLPPLRTTSKNSTHRFEHVPAENEGEKKEALERIEQSKLRRKVEQGVASKFAGNSLTADADDNAKSWAQKMLENKVAAINNDSEKKNKSIKKKKLKQKSNNIDQEYDESDLKGMNVAHSLHELQDGTTTVLTLADAPILKTREDISQKIIGLNDDDEVDLENINLAEQRVREEGLKEKRKLEMGMGRAGGYAGFDDDEFVELGGTQAPSRWKSSTTPDGTNDKKSRSKKRGFRIGDMLQDNFEQMESDLFAGPTNAISLEPARADVAASDFMSAEEEIALREQNKNKKNKKEEKDKKFNKKEKKDKKNKKKSSKRRDIESDDEEVGKPEITISIPKKGLLEELEETALSTSGTRKRRYSDDEANNNKKEDAMEIDDDRVINQAKRAKYDEVIAKGNERSRLAFQKKSKPLAASAVNDEEPDDAFLSAALAKARRLNRLKEISGMNKATSIKSGADAVAVVIQKVKEEQQTGELNKDTSQNTMTFSINETREFTRALRARTEQAEREMARKTAAAMKKEISNAVSTEAVASSNEPIGMQVKEEDIEEDVEEMDIDQLAKEVKEDDGGGVLDGATGTSIPLGRGVGNMLNLLKQTGELTRKNAGKEEMRGRSRDKRTYEDYEPLDLKNVVRIDERSAKSKDLELANREVKLEYRDKHGRLLTRKEAFRDLCYQFHGYGSGKRKEEKKMQQIEREQAQIRLASKQAAEGGAVGTFGALKATQKATGKAFVVHKTT